MNKAITKIATVICVTGVLSGCAAAAIGGGTYAVQASKRSDLQLSAEAGDARAQYELGKSWCCMGPGFDTQIATEWLCKSAEQNNTDALIELGRIYSGEVSRTPAPGQKILRMAVARNSPEHAYAFFSEAAIAGSLDAAKRAAVLLAKHGDKLKEPATFIRDSLKSSCEYNDVFSKSKNGDQT